MSRGGTIVATILLWSLTTTPLLAQPRSYALVIGYNGLPHGVAREGLFPLRYADDDAVRYSQFFNRFAEQVRLLAILDAATQKRYPSVSEIARPPTVDNLEAAIAELEQQLSDDRSAGKESVVYFVFSGHGSISPDGAPSLALSDGGISRAYLYEQILARLPATYVHLIVDACNSGAVVGMRGFFDEEVDAQTVPVSPQEALEIVNASSIARFPHVGAIIATTAGQEAHEWSRIESGVFSHEILSALSGAGDVNGDDRIEYTEVQAFVAAANREIEDPRALPNVVARPPATNRNVALVALPALREVSILEGRPAELGHFFVELGNGQRYLDANVTGMPRVALRIPRERVVYVRTATAEAEVPFPRGERVRFAQLQFKERAATSRGAIDAAYRRALFRSPFTAAYYRGFVDSIGAVSVTFDAPPRVEARSNAALATRPWAIAAWSVAGASLVASGIFVGLTVAAKSDFDGTSLQRPAHEANDRYVLFRALAIGTGIAAVAAAVAGWLLWPSDEAPELALSPFATPHGHGLVVGGIW